MYIVRVTGVFKGEMDWDNRLVGLVIGCIDGAAW